MSISKVQAQALAEGFLDDLGSISDELFRPKELYSELILLASEMVEEMQENLIESKHIATGKLAESITATKPEKTGTELLINILMNFYGKFQNKGVKGTRSGSGLYQFKTEFPSIAMVEAISEWIKRSQRSIRTVKQYDSYGRHEGKLRSVAELDSAYAVARSIKMKGLKPSGFLDKAVESTRQKFSDRLGAALKIDVLDALGNK